MHLSIENLVARKYYGDEGAIDVIAGAGFDAIDYDICDMTREEFDDLVLEKGLPYAVHLREYAESRGVYFCQSHAPYAYRYGIAYDESDREFFEIVRSMEFAAALGSPIHVVHGIRIPPEVDLIEENYKFYSALLPYAEKYGVTVGIENMPGSRFMVSETYNAIIDKMNSPYMKGCFDIGHANVSMHHPDEFIRESAKRIVCLHTHDNDGKEDLHMLPTLHRNANFTVEWDKVAQALRDTGYDGVFDLELCTWMAGFTPALLPEALRLAVSVGHELIRMCGQEPTRR